MALKVEGVVSGGMHAEEALSGSSRFEPLHLALSSPYRLMRILGSIVFSEGLFIRAGQLQFLGRRAVGAQLATVPVVWTASGENKLRLVAGCWFHDSPKSNSSCLAAGCCEACGQPPTCGQGGGNAWGFPRLFHRGRGRPGQGGGGGAA